MPASPFHSGFHLHQQHRHPQHQQANSEPPRFTFLMITRFTKVLLIAQTLRCIAFLVTSLPGPNYHCRPGAPDYAPPEGWFDVVARQDAFKGCGDLVFSSHTIFLMLCALVIQKYSTHTTFKRAVWALVAIFAMFCVAARKHCKFGHAHCIGFRHSPPNPHPPSFAHIRILPLNLNRRHSGYRGRLLHRAPHLDGPR